MKSLAEYIREGRLKDKFGHQINKMMLGKDVAIKPLKYLARIVEAMSDCGYKYMEDVANKCLESVDTNNKKTFKKYLIDNKIVAQWKDIKNERGFVDNEEFVKNDVEKDDDYLVVFGELGKKWTVLAWGFTNWDGTVVSYRMDGYAVSIEDIKNTLIKEAINTLKS